MTEQNPLEMLARARQVTGHKKCVLGYARGKRPAMTGTKILLHIVGWLSNLLGVITLGFTLYMLTATVNLPTHSEMATLMRGMLLLVAAGGLFYFFLGCSYVLYAITFSRGAAVAAIISSCVALLLLVIEATLRTFTIAQQGLTPTMAGKFAVSLLFGALVIAAMIAVVQSRNKLRAH